MGQWEEVHPSNTDSSSPFGDVAPVDGLVYAEDEIDPELRVQHNMFAPPPVPVDRPMPQRPQSRTAEPWRPGGEIDVAKYRPKPKRTNPVKVFVSILAPLFVLAVTVLFVMELYGFL